MGSDLFLGSALGEQIAIPDIVDVDVVSKVAFVRGCTVGKLGGDFCSNGRRRSGRVRGGLCVIWLGSFCGARVVWVLLVPSAFGGHWGTASGC